MKRKQKMKLQNFKILTLAVVFFSSISLDVYADEEALSKRDLVEIENRVENMNAYELNERREALMEEAAFLQAEQGSSQSPTRSRAISSRLSEITAELSFIQKALIGLGSIAILNNLSDDGYDDNVPPVITITGNATVTVELEPLILMLALLLTMHFMVQHPLPLPVVLTRMLLVHIK